MRAFGASLCLSLTVLPATAQDQANAQAVQVIEQMASLAHAELDGTTKISHGLFGPPNEVTGRIRSDSASLFPIDDLAWDRDGRSGVSREPAFSLGLAPQSAQKPPEPGHTGLKALAVETGRDFKAFPRRRSTWVILAIGAGAAAAAYTVDDEVNEHFMTSTAADPFFVPGKIIGNFYVQMGAAAGLYAIGRYALPQTEGESRTNKVSHIGFDMIRALIVSQVFTLGIKNTVRRDRPTGECCAFPSGHASATFATASVLERHFGYRGSWPMFLIATYVATSRLADNRHFLSDVMFGASLGIASGWTVVGRHGRSSYALTPVPIRGGVMLALTRDFVDKPPRFDAYPAR